MFRERMESMVIWDGGSRLGCAAALEEFKD